MPVALVKSVLPAKVVEPSMLASVELNCPPTVVEAVMAREPLEVPLPREKVRPVRSPVLEMEKRVEETPVLLVEAMAKRLESTEVEAACTPNVAKTGVLDPTVREPRAKVLPVVVAPPEIVRPPACVPLPMVEEAETMTPSVVVGAR